MESELHLPIAGVLSTASRGFLSIKLAETSKGDVVRAFGEEGGAFAAPPYLLLAFCRSRWRVTVV